MKSIERRVAQEAKAVTRKEVILKAIEGKLSWLQAADILGITPRHIRRLKKSYEQGGWGGLRDHRSGAPRRKRLPVATMVSY
jgi:transposase